MLFLVVLVVYRKGQAQSHMQTHTHLFVSLSGPRTCMDMKVNNHIEQTCQTIVIIFSLSIRAYRRYHQSALYRSGGVSPLKTPHLHWSMR